MAYLYLNDNGLSGFLTDEFLNSIIFVELLDLSSNKLSGHIPTSIGDLPNLGSQNLRGNQFEGRIPIQLCNLLRLSTLDLSNNNLNGPIPNYLSKLGFCGLMSLDGFYYLPSYSIPRQDLINSLPLTLISTVEQVELTTKNMNYVYKGDALFTMSGLDLSCNVLTGWIPHELGNLTNLHALNLSHNRLWGPIPASLSGLYSIESFDLSYNHLNGSIPTMLTTLDTLEVFNVSYNNLSGRIPDGVHFTTFDASSYQGNPFLCGSPLSKKCTTSESASPTSSIESQDKVEDGDWIDMETFYVTFVVSGVTMFLAVVIIMMINPHWRNVLFCLVKGSVTSSYYFFEDSMRKLRRARRV